MAGPHLFLAAVVLLLAPAIWATPPDSKKQASMPQPWTRVLSLQEPYLNGSDVLILQWLVNRSPFVESNITKDGIFGSVTAAAVKAFQAGNNVSASGVFDATTATLLLALHSYDGYKDDDTILPGFLYKVYIPVSQNRSIEPLASLYDSSMNLLLQYRVRLHGQNDPSGNALNQFSGSGSTPTGLTLFDLQSPEDDPLAYGPFPVNRAVQGILGNAALLESNIRDGILQHTGLWPNWNPTMPMPNSEGCVHGHPDDINKVWQILVGLGVQIRPNTFGALPYPYKPQGLLSVEQID